MAEIKHFIDIRNALSSLKEKDHKNGNKINKYTKENSNKDFNIKKE
jgi:hypothetical protein